MKGRGGCVRSFGHEHVFCQAEKGRKHRSPHELCGKACYWPWPPNPTTPILIDHPHPPYLPKNGSPTFMPYSGGPYGIEDP